MLEKVLNSHSSRMTSFWFLLKDDCMSLFLIIRVLYFSSQKEWCALLWANASSLHLTDLVSDPMRWSVSLSSIRILFYFQIRNQIMDQTRISWKMACCSMSDKQKLLVSSLKKISIQYNERKAIETSSHFWVALCSIAADLM